MHAPVQTPLSLELPESGILVAESNHGPAFRMKGEKHGFHELYVVRRGTIHLEDERLETPMHVGAGGLWPIPADTWHRMDDTAESVLLLVCLGPAYLQAAPDRETLWRSLSHTRTAPVYPDSVHFGAIVDSLNRIMAEQRTHHAGGRLLIAAEFDRLLVQLARMPREHRMDTATDRVRHVIQLLDRQFYEPWDIDRAAERAHLSRRRFTALFKSLAGETFNRRLNTLRLRNAMVLLAERRHSIPGAALASGFQDLSHFYRIFRRETGCSPGAWLEAENRAPAVDQGPRTFESDAGDFPAPAGK